MSNDILLPAELEAPEPPKIVNVNEEERAKLHAQGYWVDSKNRLHHLKDMPTQYIINILGKIWQECQKKAIQNAKVSVDEIFMQSGEGNPDAWGYDWEDPRDFWEAHPFVPLAKQALRIRNIAYEDPSEKDFNDADNIPF